MRKTSDLDWRPHLGRLSIGLVLALAGCAPHTSELQSSPESVRSAQLDGSLCRPSPALLTPQSAPDCAFDQSHLKTIDPLQWSRLKVEYEKTCYQRAERAVRERLRELQAASKCEIASRQT